MSVSAAFKAFATELSLKTPDLLRSQVYVNSAWISAASGSTFQVQSPATGQVIGEVPDLQANDVTAAIEAAKVALPAWGKTTAKYRSDMVLKLYHLMQEHKEDLAKIITGENGKPLADARGEVDYGAGFFEWFSAEAVRSYGDVIPSAVPGLRNLVLKQPIGVCSILACWNFPTAMITRKMAPAIAAGCTVVIKAPPETPFSALALARLVEIAGFPKGVVNIITTGRENQQAVGEEMTKNPIVKKVSFTGSSPVGKLLMTQSSSTLKKCSFELGGNAVFMVFDDADVDKAVDGLVASKYRLSGQTCVCANRVYIHESIYEEFAKKLVAKVAAFKVGNGFEAGVTHGPLIHDRAVAKTATHVANAVGLGAKVLIGGNAMPELGPHFFAPTVLADVPQRGTLMDEEETFGPVAALIKFSSEDEVMQLANDTQYGLAGYFFTKDLSRAFRVAEALEVGMVGVNTGLISQTSIPFGGIKESGFGREGSKYGMSEYEVTKLMAVQI